MTILLRLLAIATAFGMLVLYGQLNGLDHKHEEAFKNRLLEKAEAKYWSNQ